jgi:hypothetical protein
MAIVLKTTVEQVKVALKRKNSLTVINEFVSKYYVTTKKNKVQETAKGAHERKCPKR